MKAQMVFSTHNTNLLSDKILRRDQIYIIDKDPFGASKIQNLVEKGIRNDASFEKAFIRREYDGVPFRGNENSKLNLFDDKDNLTLF